MSAKEIQLTVATDTLQLLCDQWNKIDSMPVSVKRSNQLAKLETWIDTVNDRISQLTEQQVKQAI
jgi:hypothetical protein